MALIIFGKRMRSAQTHGVKQKRESLFKNVCAETRHWQINQYNKQFIMIGVLSIEK